MRRRTRIDIYANILDIIKINSDGIRLTRISYGAGIPTDRARMFIDQLLNAGLIATKSGANLFFILTKHGRKFLESYYVLKGYLTEMDEDLSSKKR